MLIIGEGKEHYWPKAPETSHHSPPIPSHHHSSPITASRAAA